jgi:hypothetical protein
MITIKEEEGKYNLYNVNHSYVPTYGKIETLTTYMKVGEVKDLAGLELEKEYDYTWHLDFDIVERAKQVLHDNGLVYDDLVWRIKPEIMFVETPQPPKDDEGSHHF